MANQDDGGRARAMQASLEDYLSTETVRALYGRLNDPPLASLTHQGAVVEAIPVDARSLRDGDASGLVQSTVDFVNSMGEDALFLPGEYPIAALWSYSVDVYLELARLGGHWHWVNVSEGDRAVEAGCVCGLLALGADDFLTLLQESSGVLAQARGMVKNSTGTSGHVKAGEWLKGRFLDLDRRFHALNEARSLKALNAAWLRGLDNLRPVEPGDLASEYERLVLSNPLRLARRNEIRLAREIAEARDPVHRAVKELCRKAKLDFAGLTAGIPSLTPEAKGRREHAAFLWGVRTGSGVYEAYFFDRGGLFRRYQGELYERKTDRVLASASVSHADYLAIVPEAVRQVPRSVMKRPRSAAS